MGRPVVVPTGCLLTQVPDTAGNTRRQRGPGDRPPVAGLASLQARRRRLRADRQQRGRTNGAIKVISESTRVQETASKEVDALITELATVDTGTAAL